MAGCERRSVWPERHGSPHHAGQTTTCLRQRRVVSSTEEEVLRCRRAPMVRAYHAVTSGVTNCYDARRSCERSELSPRVIPQERAERASVGTPCHPAGASAASECGCPLGNLLALASN